MKFFAFAASHRPQSLNRMLAQQAAHYVQGKEHEVQFGEYETLNMPLYNDAQYTEELLEATPNPFVEHIAEVDGIIISSPEYNWSYPGTLKNIIDWTSRLTPCPLAEKTVLLMCATPAKRGGVSGLMHLRAPFDALNAAVYHHAFPLGNAHSLLKEGALKDKRTLELFEKNIDDYLDFTHKLRS